MIVFSKDRKTIAKCKALAVTKNFGGKKDEKYAIVGCINDGVIEQTILALYPDEKTALDELEKIYEAFAGGAKTYKL